MLPILSTHTHTHRAAALVHPDAAVLLLGIGGLESQQVLPSPQAVIITEHPHYQIERVAVQNVLYRNHNNNTHYKYHNSRQNHVERETVENVRLERSRFSRNFWDARAFINMEMDSLTH
jgi:hypothetical protein